MATVEERVASGAYMLDVHYHDPDWRDTVDLERLNTRSCTDCVLGQLYGEYCDGLVAMGIWDENPPPMIRQSRLGFAIDLDELDHDLMPPGMMYSAYAADEAFARLDAEWRRVLNP